jgi:DHA2 family multidrug resistance protein
MSSIALQVSSGTAGRRTISPWLIAAAVVVPTFMEILDTTIANVALRYIAGGLSAAVIDSDWVITSYLAANAFILPITGWLSAHFGRKNYFLLSIGVFTVASAMCGLSRSLGQLILFRILQGMAGGGLQPSSQSILLDTFPPEKQGAAQTMFGVAALLGPIVGPTLGGWLVVNYDWRWIFYVNVPTGIVGLLACYALLDDPDYLKAERTELKKKPFNLDGIGLALLALMMASWEIILSKGQEWDWISDPFWRIQTLLVVLIVALAGLLWRELTFSHPVVNFRVLRERNFAVCCVIIFCIYGVLYQSSVALPAMLQSLFGYDAYVSGLVMSPSGFFAIVMMVIVGALLGRGTDARWLIAVGLLTVGAASYWMAIMNLQISPWQVVWPRVLLVVGLSLIFAPLNVAAYIYTPKQLRGAAVGLMALLRNEGGSFGTSMSQTIQERRQQFHAARLDEWLGPLNPHVTSFLQQGQLIYARQTSDPNGAANLALQSLDNLRQQQASSLAYFDVFWTSAVLAAALVLLVLIMKRSVAEKGAHIGSE